MSVPQKALRRFATHVQEQADLFLELKNAAKELLTRADEEADWERRLQRLKDEEAIGRQTLKELSDKHQALLEELKAQRTTQQEALKKDREQRDLERREWTKEVQRWRDQREAAQVAYQDMELARKNKEHEVAELNKSLIATVDRVLHPS